MSLGTQKDEDRKLQGRKLKKKIKKGKSNQESTERQGEDKYGALKTLMAGSAL